MGLGSTAKNIQTVADRAEQLYGKMNEMREQLTDLRGTVEETGDRVAALDGKVERQQAIIEALAEKQGIDVENVTDDVHSVGDGSVAPPADETSGEESTAAGGGAGDEQATGNAN